MCKRYTHMHTICYGHTITHQRQTREQQQPPYIREQPCSFVFILLQFVACLYPKQMYIFIYFGYRHCHTLLQCGRIHNYYLSFGPNSRKLYLIEIFKWWLCMGLACDAPSPDRNILILSETPFFPLRWCLHMQTPASAFCIIFKTKIIFAMQFETTTTTKSELKWS